MWLCAVEVNRRFDAEFNEWCIGPYVTEWKSNWFLGPGVLCPEPMPKMFC